MEEKKFDSKTIIGLALISVIMIWMLYNNSPTQEEVEAEQAKTEKIASQEKESDKTLDTAKVAAADFSNLSAKDSLAQLQLQNELGAFAYSASLASASEHETVLEN